MALLAPGRSAALQALLVLALLVLALLVLALLVLAPSALGQVTTTTTYTYDEVNLLPDTVTVSSSDGAYRRTVTAYAHGAYSGMEGENMLSQVYRTVVLDGAGAAVACSETRWQHWGALFWVPSATYAGCGAEAVRASSLDHADSYDGRGRVVHLSDAAGLHVHVFYGEETAPFSNGLGNPRVTGVRRTGYYMAADQGQALEERYSYDGLGRVDTVYDANGRRAAFAYDGLGRLVETENDAGETVTTHEYAYSSAATGAYDPARPNRVTTVSHGSAHQAATEWLDGLGRPVGATAYETGSYDFGSITEYDALGRASKEWRPARLYGEGTRTYPSTPNSGYGAPWAGGVYKVPGTSSGQFGYDSKSYWDGRPNVSAADAAAVYTETTYEASPLGRPVSVRGPGAADGLGAEGDGVTYRYGVDRPDARASALGGGHYARPEGAAPVMAYTETEDAGGRKTRVYTDALGRERFVRAGVGTADEALTETVYDAADRAVAVRPPTFFSPRSGEAAHQGATTYVYDTRGELVAATTPDGGLTETAAALGGRLRVRQDADQRSRTAESAYGRASFYEADEVGRLLNESWAPLACPVADVDAVTGKCPGGVDAAGTRTWVRINRYDDPAVNRWNDPDQVNGWPHNLGVPFTFENALGRLAAEGYQSDGAWHSVFYAYDAEGRVSRRLTKTDGVTDPYTDARYTYDRAGLLRDVTVEVGADAFRRRYTYRPNGQVQYASSGVGASGTTVPVSTEASYSYDAAGALEYRSFYGVTSTGTGTTNEYRWYDVAGRLTHVQDPSYSAALFRERLSYAPGGLISAVVSRAPDAGPYSAWTSTYDSNAKLREWQYALQYDGLGRLTGATYGSPYYGSSSSYGVSGVQYDANGNVLALTRRAPTGSSGSGVADALSYTYAAGKNRLTNVADGASTAALAWAGWDAERSALYYRPHGLVYAMNEYPVWASGSSAYDRRYTYRYDEGGLPLYEYQRRWDDGAGAYRYTYLYARYDGAGRRVWRRVRVGGVDTDERYVVDGGAVVGVLDGAGTVKHWNTSTGRITPAGERFVYRRDHLGSVRAVQRASDGVLVEARDHYPFGLQMPGRVYVQGTPTREDFTGHELDAETGLHYAGARYYMAALGRFTSVDPHAANYPGWSPYHYAANNPISITDPTGMDWVCETGEDGECGSKYYYHDSYTADSKDLGGEGRKYVGATAEVFYEGRTFFLEEGGTHTVIGGDWRAETIAAGVASGELDGDFLTSVANQLPRSTQAAIGQGLVHRGHGEFLEHPVTQATITGLSFFVGGGGILNGVKNAKIPVWRVYGGGSGRLGAYWTPLSPNLAGSRYRNLAGLPWENLGNHLVRGSVRVRDITSFGRAARIGHMRGGWPEVTVWRGAVSRVRNLPTTGF